MGGGGVQRTVKFIKYLPSFGWEPIIVCADDKLYWARDETLLRELPKNLKIHRLPSLRPWRIRALLDKIFPKKLVDCLWESIFVPDDRIFWAIWAAMYALTLIRKENVKVIYSTSPPHSTHAGAFLLRKLTGIPWVADFRDPWTKAFLYRPPNRTVKKIHKTIENKLFSADRVIFITKTIRAWYLSDTELNARKCETIYNGYDGEDFTTLPPTKKKGEKIKMVHSGSFYGKYYPETFFSALSMILAQDAKFKKIFTISFIGRMDQKIKENITRLLGKNAVFYGLLPHKKAIKFIGGADINFLGLPLTHRTSYVITGKIFEYLAVKKPILAVVPSGEVSQIITSTRGGVVLTEKDTENLQHSLKRIILELKNTNNFSPDWGTISQFERKNQTKQLARIFDELTMVKKT